MLLLPLTRWYNDATALAGYATTMMLMMNKSKQKNDIALLSKRPWSRRGPGAGSGSSSIHRQWSAGKQTLKLGR